MGRAQLSGVLLLVGAAVGCGGQLAQPDGGGGGTGGGDPLPHIYTWVAGTVRVLYGCDGRLSQVVVETCAQQADLASMYPGCLSLILTETFVAGDYVQAGVRWQVTAATAELRLPPSLFEGGPPDQTGVGVGTFTAECRDTAGNGLTLDGLFAVPVLVSALLC